MNKPIALILGGTLPHSAAIELLKTRGYYTILVDYLADSPGKAVADEHIRESALDPDAVRRIAVQRNVRYVMCPCLDRPLKVAAQVAQELKLPFPISYETALDATLKDRMKALFVRGGIPTSKYNIVRAADKTADSGLVYPLIVKPTDNSGSAGITVVEGPEALAAAIDYALGQSTAKAVVVEEFIAGNEVSIYTFVKNRRPHVLLTQLKHNKATDDNPQLRGFSAIAPAPLSATATKQLLNLAGRISTVFRLENTPMFFQCIINKKSIHVIECAPRLNGGFGFTNIKAASGFDILGATIDCYEGKPVKISAHPPTAYRLTHQIYGKRGVFSGYTGLDETVAAGLVEKWYFHKPLGTAICGDKPSGARIAAFLTQVDRKEDLPLLVETVMASIDFLDIDGRSIFDRRYQLMPEDLEE